MSVKSAQSVTVLFSTANASTGAAADASSTPTGTLYVNGTANGATVTVTNLATGLYKASVTLPSLTAGDVVSLRVAATVSAVAGEGVIWQEVADTERVSDLNDPTAATVATAVRSELATELARIDASISDLPTNAELTSALAAADDAVLAAIADVPTVAEFEARTLLAADYTIVSDLPVAPDNASIAAILVDTGTTLDALVKDVPTNAELTSALAAADDATLAAIAALNNLSSAEAQSAAAAALTAYGPPTKAELDSAVAPLATAAALDTVDNLLDTEVAAIKAVTDNLATALELDGAVYRLTANALELAPSGGGGATVEDIWSEMLPGAYPAGSAAQFLGAAGGASDPLLNLVPGDYASGTAGAALGSLAGASVSVVSPVASDGTTIDLIFGDDYYAADGRALLFNAEGATLTGNPVYLRVRNNVGAVSIPGVVTGAHTCYFEVTSVQLSSIGIGEWRYDFEYILPTTHVITVLHDRIMRVKQDAR